MGIAAAAIVDATPVSSARAVTVEGLALSGRRASTASGSRAPSAKPRAEASVDAAACAHRYSSTWLAQTLGDARLAIASIKNCLAYGGSLQTGQRKAS
jgi:hypothetical protein